MANDSSRRYFSEAERREAFVKAEGLCQLCGAPLPADFHADHVTPFVAGGPTHTDNLQALCPACNLKKGAALPEQIPMRAGRKAREWQQKAFLIIKRAQSKSALIQATPGAGKTDFACGVASSFMARGLVKRVLVVSPLANLKDDWARSMARMGIQLDPDSTGRARETSDYHGRSLTYAALTTNGRNGGADIEHVLQSQTDTLVFLDEVHHAGDQAAWGLGLKVACEQAAFVVCLSGTPFRTDGNPIPFVQYDTDGRAIADYVYSYSEAIRDKVCRPVYFPAYEADVSWLRDDALYRASFNDTLNQNQESDRLRAALFSDDWVTKQLQDANAQLCAIRSTHPDAAGLVIAIDQKHARYISELMARVTHSRPTLVLSDDDDSDARIATFRRSTDPWIIAVRKVSEGVDIPRLRVCAYLTNVITEMFFRQVVGRVVRYVHGIEHQEAFVFIPSDRRIVEMAERIKQERIDSILSNDQGEPEDQERTQRDLLGRSGFNVLDGSAWHDKTITYDGETFTHEQIEAVRGLAERYHLRPEVVAKMCRDGVIPGLNGHAPEPKPTFEQAREKKSSTKRKRLLAEIRNRFLRNVRDDREAYKQLNRSINRALGISSGTNKTLDMRDREMALLEDAIVTGGASWL